jgi:hypothetical protein
MNNDIDGLIERLRSSAKAFRENPVYDSAGDGCFLSAQALECEEAASALSASQAEIVRLREALNRVRAAVEYEEPAPRDELDRTLAADVAGGLSLRACAEKHGVKLGRVRGAVSRAALSSGEKADG